MHPKGASACCALSGCNQPGATRVISSTAAVIAMRIRYLLLVFFLAVTLFIALVRTLRALRLVYLSRGPEPICPFCGAKRIRKSGAALTGDGLYRCFAFFPYRCRVCFARFYRPRTYSPGLMHSVRRAAASNRDS